MISVVLAIYNGIGLMEQAIDSVLQQTYQNWELLILDDCSKDNSWAYLQTLNDSRIKLFRNEQNKGLFYNLNFLIKQSKGSVIKLWSQDDIMYTNCLEETWNFHQKYPNISFSYSDRDIIDESGTITHKYNGWDTTPEIISVDLHAKIFLYTGSIAGNIANVAISKWALDKYGLFREDMKYAADLDMWERLTVENEIGRIRLPLIQLRNHTNQLSRKKGYAIYQLKEDLEVFDRLNKRLRTEELRNFSVLCRKWKREVYYMAVFLNLIKKRSTRESIKYYAFLTMKSSFIIIMMRFLISRLGYKKIKLY